jgi:hypothetical protein
MFLYNLTLQRSTAITCTAYGNFSAAKQHEIVVSHGKTLEMLKPYVFHSYFPLRQKTMQQNFP